VKQRRQDLLDQYKTKRSEMQRVNKTLGKDAGMNDPEFNAIRQAVSLLPDKPGQTGSTTAEDLGIGTATIGEQDSTSMPGGVGNQGGDLSNLMKTHQGDTSGSGSVSPEGNRLATNFTKTPLSGQTGPGGQARAVGRKPSSGEVTDVGADAERARKEKEAQEGEKSKAKTAREEARRKEWVEEMNRLTSERQKQEELVADLLKKKQEIGAQLTAEAAKQTGGVMSNKDYQDALNRLDRDYQREKARLDRINANIRNHGNGPGGQGSGNGSGSGSGGTGTGGGQGGPAPGVKVDRRTVNCSTTTKSGRNAPATITVQMGQAIGTAKFTYSMISIKDRMIVKYGGGTVLDTGCVSGNGGTSINLTGESDTVTVIVQPACDGGNTRWSFTVECPTFPAVQGAAQ
jgi:hypothetical protein